MSVLVKLGKKASSFSDPVTGINLSGKEVIEITDGQAKTKRIVQALGGGHLVRASKFELQSFQRFLKESTVTQIPVSTKDSEKLILSLQEKLAEKAGENAELKQRLEELESQGEEAGNNNFTNMDDVQLVDYYKSTYEVSKKELKAFEELSTEAKIAELLSLEE